MLEAGDWLAPPGVAACACKPCSNSTVLATPMPSVLQAWIVFADIAAATNALRGMQGFPFYEKPVVRILEYLGCAAGCVEAGVSGGGRW